MEAIDGYQLCFDRVRKSYATKNRRYIIRPPLSEALKKEELSDSDLDITSYVLRTGNATMFFLEEVRILRQPFDAGMLKELKAFCSRRPEIGDQTYESRKIFLTMLETNLKKETKAQRDSRRAQARFRTLESAMAPTGSDTTAGEGRNNAQQASMGPSTTGEGEGDASDHEQAADVET